jgi:hypothetical protein
MHQLFRTLSNGPGGIPERPMFFRKKLVQNTGMKQDCRKT